MKEEKTVETVEEKETKRYYTHCIVSYASLEEVQPLLEQAKHYAYVLHDKVVEDSSNGVHYHIIATFEREKSFAWVRKQVHSDQNTFTEPLKGDVEDMLEYFTHKNEPEKGQYHDSIVYDDYEYWKRRARTGDKEENKNDTFVDDLISSDFSIERMSRKYGRDFIKNYKSYLDARNAILFERGQNNLVQETRAFQSDLDEAIACIDDYNKTLSKRS
jgi:hypothetical protein